MTRGRPLPDGLAALHLDRYTVARIRHHALALARDLPPGAVATVDAAGLTVAAPSPAVLAVLAERTAAHCGGPTLRAREIGPGLVLASTEAERPPIDTCWAWLVRVDRDGTLRHVDSAGGHSSRADAEAAVLARMGR